MNAISSPGYSTTSDYNSDMVDFVEFSTFNFPNTKHLINKYQNKANQSAESLIESLLTLEEKNYQTLTQASVNDTINNYTTYIEIEKIRFDKKLLDLFIHFNILNKLEKNNVINWHSNTSLFYPIKTLGDGNCLVSV